MKKLKTLVLASLGILLVCSCTNPSSESNEAQTGEASMTKTAGQAFVEDDVSNPNVLQIAIKSEDHSTLVAAVQAADLENSLVNAGPLMVFAPVNEAFDKLPAGTVEDLLKPDNKEKLVDILTYHVTPGNYSKDFLKNFEKLGQANDQSVAVEIKGDDVYVGGAKIIASVKASNGIVHVVNAVLLPPDN